MGFDRKDIPKITSLFLMEQDQEIQIQTILFLIIYVEKMFKLPNNLSRILFKNNALGKKRFLRKKS